MAPDTARPVIAAITAEYRRYHNLAEDVFVQLDERELCARPPGEGNSVATLVWHLSGNLQSRFTDFLESDGEKPWRQREEEFLERRVTRAELLEKWKRGWAVLFDELGDLTDEDLQREVRIRAQALTVIEALARSLAHCAYHVGQIVLLAREHKGADWRFLSIPPGGTDAYNANPDRERPPS